MLLTDDSKRVLRGHWGVAQTLIRKHGRLAMKIATDIIPKLPKRGDGVVDKVIKCIGIADSVSKYVSPDSRHVLDVFTTGRGLVSTKNEQFVSLFFTTNLREQFHMRMHKLDDYLSVVEAVHPELGSLYFSKTDFSDTHDSDFYHAEGFGFSDLLGGLWHSYDGRMHVTVGPGRWGHGSSTQFAKFGATPNPLYGRMLGTMDALVARHRRYRADKLPRAYSFYGKPGTGKSSFALAFAEKLGTRTMKLDATSFEYTTVKDIGFLIDNLEPDFIVIDDVDKAKADRATPTLLDILQRFKTDWPNTSVILTANSIDTFDNGFFRPGRVDTWLEFEMPAESERQEIISRYVTELKLPTSQDTIKALAQQTEGLSQDYLREIAMLLRVEDLEDVMKSVELMKKMVLPKTEAKAEEKKDTPK